MQGFVDSWVSGFKSTGLSHRMFSIRDPWELRQICFLGVPSDIGLPESKKIFSQVIQDPGTLPQKLGLL